MLDSVLPRIGFSFESHDDLNQIVERALGGRCPVGDSHRIAMSHSKFLGLPTNRFRRRCGGESGIGR
jgi:hypothetical protein